MSKEAYAQMQIAAYNEYSNTFEKAKKECVGWWEAHEKYPYENYLLARYDGPKTKALDFGCGVGRMIKRMSKIFDSVDGIDLSKNNLEHSKQYLGEGYTGELFLANGISCNIQKSNHYDFIYSTICIQHICVHETRHQILKDFFRLLKNGGQVCIQVGYGWDNGTHWEHNIYDAKGTNSAHDFSIPDVSHFSRIQEDLIKIGFSNIVFNVRESPHPELKDYHPNWLFIYMEKGDGWQVDDHRINNYNNIVDSAISNEEVFGSFKTHPSYNSIVGMSEDWQAEKWYEELKHSDIFKSLDVFRKNDTIGGFPKWVSPDDIEVSAATLRYMNTLKEITESFEFKETLNVVELGVGYGGLCFVLSNYLNINSYCLVDLPNVQKLAQKYLGRLGVNSTLEVPETTDLFISEFCLSEFSDSQIYKFYDMYIKNSKRIYLHMNLHDEVRKQRFLNKLSKDFTYNISDEFPKTHYPNYVITGTK